MRRFRILGWLALGLLASPAAFSQGWPELSADYSAYLARQDPLTAGQRGDRAAAARWPDDRPAALAAAQRQLRDFQVRLQSIATAQLSATDALSHAVMARQISVALDSLAFDEARLPFQDGEGFFTLAETQAAVTVLRDEDSAQAWFTRLSTLAAYLADETDNLRRGMRTGFTQPAQTVDKAIIVVQGLADESPERSALLLPFATLPMTMPLEHRDVLRQQAVAVIKRSVRPAQARLAVFLRSEYRAKARAQLGAGSLDGGRYYAFAIRRHTTTELDAAAIHRIGIEEVARIQKSMEAIKVSARFTGSLREFLAASVANPALHAANDDIYALHAGEIAKRIDYLLPQYFGLLPRLTYGVHGRPPGLDAISSGYLPGSPESGVAGAVVYGAEPGKDLASLPAWLLHEGVPGHHLQIALAQENTALPDYRRSDDVTAFVEGWALYAERLGEEMGVYRNDDERLGRLSFEIWRACRLQIDTGLHAMGWTRAQAAQCLLDNTALSREFVYREIDRYIGWPGQALAYKLGELTIVDLRRQAEAKQGARFDLRAFHDRLLSGGALPLDLLRLHMRDFSKPPTAEK